MKNISIRKFVRIILYCLIYPTIKSCDITVENHSLSPEFKQDLLYIFEIYNIFHAFKFLSPMQRKRIDFR